MNKIIPNQDGFILVMKISLIQVFILTAFVSGAAAIDLNGQQILERRVSINAENKEIKDILRAISKQTSARFSYRPQVIQASRKVSLNVEEAALGDVFESLFGPEITYRVVGKEIVFRVRSASDILTTDSLTYDKELADFAVSGTVTSENGEALPGVNVLIKGTTKGAVTDSDGHFVINVPDADAVLVFSFIGFTTREIALDGKAVIDVILSEALRTLDEVVVVGYGTVKKSDLTGAVSSVSAEELTAFPALDAIQSMQGRAAGVEIQSLDGEPGSPSKIRIRGGTSINASSDPLIVVDGFPGGTMPPPEDIESIEILKDASSTAIYGSRGANGVIMVSTKTGEAGETRIDFSTSYSFQKETKRMDLLGKDDFIDYIEEARPGVLGDIPAGPGTDWQDEIFRPGNTQNYNLAVRGGNQNVKYYVSGIVYDQTGILLSSDYQRYSLTSNIDIKASKRFKIGANIFLRKSESNGVPTQDDYSSANTEGAVAAAIEAEPTIPVYDENGNYSLIHLINVPKDNAVAILNERQDESSTDALQANFYGEYTILDGLTLKVVGGANNIDGRNGNYLTKKLITGGGAGGDGSVSGNKYTDLINEDYLTYTKAFDVHTLTLLGGYSYQSTSSEGWSAHSQNFLTDAFSWSDLDGGSVFQRPSSNLTETKLTSFYGRMNYKFKDKYLITLNARYDGSSRFAKNNKWAFFPSGAAAWNVAEESFMEAVPKVSQLKFRVSYGVTGNQAIGPYQSLAKLSSALYIENGSIKPAIRINSVANNDLTWESTAQTDVGIDLGLFKQRLMLNVDCYSMKTTDLLFSYPLPGYTGYSSVLKNIGATSNKGVEFTVSSVNLDREFRWTTDFNISLNKNKVLELPDGEDIIYAEQPSHRQGYGSGILREGQPVGVFYGFVYDGVIQQGETVLPGNFETEPGGEKFKDVSGPDGVPDGELTSDDRIIIGDPHPDFIWGLNNTLSFKGFDLNLFFQGSQGNDLYSFQLAELEIMQPYQNTTTEALRRWTPTNTNTDVPKVSTGRGRHPSSRWVFDGSYIRLRNIALGYTIPKTVLKTILIDNARIYVSAQNILTITKYRGFDPDVNFSSGGSSTASNRNLGLDYGSYPAIQSVTVGVNVTF